jgi:hypothetical protein
MKLVKDQTTQKPTNKMEVTKEVTKPNQCFIGIFN